MKKNNTEKENTMTGATDNIKRAAIEVIMTNELGGELPTQGMSVVKSTTFESDNTKIVVDTIEVSGTEYYITHSIG